MIDIALANKLCSWLEATTSYDTELKENITLKPNHEPTPKWRRFYQFGPTLVEDSSGVLDAEGKPTSLKLEIKHVAYDKGVQPGDIISSGNGRRYMVQPNGSIRRL